MSTRSNIKFVYGLEEFQVYKHSDGYPDFTVPQIARFLKWNGDRNDDISYTVANYILFVKLEQANIVEETIETQFNNDSNYELLHTGIGLESPCDPVDFEDDIGIQFFYIVDLVEKTVKVYNPTKLILKFSFMKNFDHMLEYEENISQ